METHPSSEHILQSADVLYDLTEELANVVDRLGTFAVSDLVTLTERVRDAAMVMTDTLATLETLQPSASSVPLEPTPVTPAEPASPAPLAEEALPDEPIPFDSEETVAIVRRYFSLHLGDPQAWDGLKQHLEQNRVITPARRTLNATVKSWMPQLQEEFATLYGTDIRWMPFEGAWIAAEVEKKPNSPPADEVAPEAPQPIVAQPVEQPVEAREVVAPPVAPSFSLDDITAAIATLPPQADYARYNKLKSYLALDDASLEELLAYYSDSLYVFRTDGTRCITANPTIAATLDTPRGHKLAPHSASKAPVEHATPPSSDAMMGILGVFLEPRVHILQAKTYQEIAKATGYDNATVRGAIKTLIRTGVLERVIRDRNPSGRRTAHIPKIKLASQEIKDELKPLDIPALEARIMERIAQNDDTLGTTEVIPQFS